MSISRLTVRTEILQRLGDTAETIWTASEIDEAIQQGYDELVIQSGCFWAMAFFPDVPACFSFTASFESAFLLDNPGWPVNGPFQFTSLCERDFLDNADGPANHNQPWEFTDGYGLDTRITAVVDLPEDLLQIERGSWNSIRLEALRSQELEVEDSRYELNMGPVQAYTQDKDGLNRLRKWRVPAAAYVAYEFDVDSDDGLGIIRFLGDISDADVVSGDFGDLCSVPNVEVLEDFGIIGPVINDVGSVRLEYQRRGLPLSEGQDFELPDRYVKYVRWFVLAKALGREGPGQELRLSQHYSERFSAGVQRMVRRKQMVQTQRQYVMGGGRGPTSRIPKVQLPWQYGQVVR